ncbi:MAG TPA: glycosyltransferase family 87 protein [Thermomicrobiales bacterium]|jgi:hypothetical protein
MGLRLARLAGRFDALLTPQRVRGYSLIFLCVGVVGYLLLPLLGVGGDAAGVGRLKFADFIARYTSGRLVLTGEAAHLYDVAAQEAVQRQLFGPSDYLSLFVSPPFSALLYLPFAALPYLPGAILWMIVSLTLLAGSAALFRPLVPRLGGSWGGVVLVVAGTQPVIELLAIGQDSALALVLWVAGIRLALARRDGAAGIVFALGLFKPQLFFLPPLLFLCLRRPRAVMTWAATGAGLGALSLLLIGPAGVRAWVELLASPLYQTAAQAGQAWKMLSFTALFRALLPVGLGGVAELLGILLGLVFAALFVVLALRSRQLGAERESALWGLAIVTTFLASPHVLIYDLVVLIPSGMLLIEARSDQRVRVALAGLALLTWTAIIRNGLFAALPWPFSSLGGSWNALPLLALWLAAAGLVGGVSWPSFARRAAVPAATPR